MACKLMFHLCIPKFSKREEAEAALRAPDAVMRNRFIKLRWANRDSIPDDGTSSGYCLSVSSHVVAAVSVPVPSAAQRGKDSLPSKPKVSVPNASGAPAPPPSQPKPVVTSCLKAPPPLQKKVELLKEEIRKKQELLDQKRNEFRRQLDNLEKQATGLRGEVPSQQAAKRLKAATLADVAKAAIPRSSDSDLLLSSPQAELMAEKIKSKEDVMHQSSKSNTIASLDGPASFHKPIHPLAPAGAPFGMKRFKLDNHPTTFKINPPVPTGLANAMFLWGEGGRLGARCINARL